MRGWAFRLSEKGKRGERMGRKQKERGTYWFEEETHALFEGNLPLSHMMFPISLMERHTSKPKREG
jgi:hypothetical protein